MTFGVNGIGVFWEDGTYDVQPATAVAALVRPVGFDGRYVGVAILQTVTENDDPVVFQANGDDRVALLISANHAVCRQMVEPPGQPQQVKESAFGLATSERVLGTVLDSPAAAGGGGMDAQFHALPDTDPTYDDLEQRFLDFTSATAFRTVAVPSSGTY